MPDRAVAVAGGRAKGSRVSWALAWLTPVVVVVIGVLFVVLAATGGGRAWWAGVAAASVLLGAVLAHGSGHPRRAGAGVAMLVAGVLTLPVVVVMMLG